MTMLGKLLVFVNLFAAVGVLAWAASAHANRVDYLDTKTADGQTIEGQISKLKKEIADMAAAASTGSTRYGANAASLARTEAIRDRRSFLLAQRLEQARKGTFSDYPKDPTNSLLDDISPRAYPPIQFRGAPLEGVAVVQNKLEKETQAVQSAIEGNKPFDPAAVAAAAGSPNLATAIEGYGVINLRLAFGLVSDRVAVVDDATRKQKDILVNLREEADFLKDQRVNWVAQLQSLDRRNKQLEERLKTYTAAKTN